MEDILLIDAAERFVNGEMSAEEKIYFEDLRKNNPELDQAVVEQLFFLNQLNQYSDHKNFKSLLNEVESNLINENFIAERSHKPTAKIIQLWHRYKKTIAVAASIAGFVSILMASLVTTVTTKNDNNINPLVQKINEQEDKTRKIEKKLDQLAEEGAVANTPTKPTLNSSFRATGFMIDAANNYLVTNAHVVKEATHRLIIENNAGEQFNATAIYVNAKNDLAIVKITDTNFRRLPNLPYNIRKNSVELGEQIFMLGYPKKEIVYSEGYVSAKNGYQLDTSYCQLSTAANEGNSGSPVISKNGDLIGIISSEETNATGVVFAIKSINIYRAIEEVKKQKQYSNIKISSNPSLKGVDRVNQVKKMEDYVFMIKGN